jgi:hypothetical protein
LESDFLISGNHFLTPGNHLVILAGLFLILRKSFVTPANLFGIPGNRIEGIIYPNSIHCVPLKTAKNGWQKICWVCRVHSQTKQTTKTTQLKIERKNMITKPSISFLTSDSDALLLTDTETILANMTGNPAFATPDPTLSEVTTAKTEFATALANAANGGIELTAIKNDKRAALAALLRNLASYVQVACNGDLTVLLSSGFPIQKPQRFPIGVLPAPTNVAVTLGTRSGELDAAMPPVFGASIYNWHLARADAPNVFVQTTQTTAASTSFEDLTPGVVYIVQVNAVGAAGPSDWSNPVSKMAV